MRIGREIAFKLMIVAGGFLLGLMYAHHLHQQDIEKHYDYNIPVERIIVEEIQHHADSTCEYQFRFGYEMFQFYGYFDDYCEKFKIGDTVRVNFR